MAQKYPKELEPSVTFQIGKTLEERPKLFALGMAVIAEHSEAESHLSSIMIALLGVNPAPGAAIFSVIRANYMQVSAVREVAAAVLDELDVEKLKNALKAFELSAGFRNTIAHRLWGVDERISDGVVFAKANAAATFSVDILRIPKLKTEEEKVEFSARAVERMNANMEIWREQDFRKAIESASQAKSELLEFYVAIIGKSMLRSIQEASAFRIVE